MPPSVVTKLFGRVDRKLRRHRRNAASRSAIDQEACGVMHQPTSEDRKISADNVVQYHQPPLLPQDFDEHTVTAFEAALCADCRKLNIGPLFDTDRISRSDPYTADLSASSSPGGYLATTLGRLRNSSPDCACCELMLSCFVRDVHLQDASLDTPLTIIFDAREKVVSVHTDGDLSNRAARTTLDTIYFNDWEPSPEVVYSNARPISRLLHSNPTIDQISCQIRGWLNLCRENCVSCSVENAEISLPSRVLDVGKDSRAVFLTENFSRDGDGPAPNTTHRAGIDADSTVQYVALSYCWGTAGQYTLNQSTRADLLGGFSPDILPKTIQDAIKLTRGLGVRFLWIDALCILQGKDEYAQKDWQEQSAMMNAIYGNAYLTIIASRSAAVQDGFLRSRNTSLLGVYCGMTDSRKPIFLCHQGSKSRSLEDVLTEEPLTTRGWAFQERILTRRSVYFGSKQMYWKCSGGERAEDDDWMVAHGGSIYSDWTKVVQDYTPCRLTNTMDRLPALAGLAKSYLAERYRGAREDQYCAGHWRKDLLETLLWHPPSTSTGVTPASEYQAPSWSWASCNGPIDWHPLGSTSEPLANLIDVQVAVPGSNPFGQVKDGWLDIEAPTKQLQHGISPLTNADLVDTGKRRSWTERYANPYVDNEDRSRIWRLTEDQLKALFPSDAAKLEEAFAAERMQIYPGYSGGQPYLVFDLREYTQLENVYLAATYRSEAVGNDSLQICGLILHAVKRYRCMYKRIGIFFNLPDLASLEVKRDILRII